MKTENNMLVSLVMDPKTRHSIAAGVVSSVSSIGMDQDAHNLLADFASGEDPAYQLYIILFGIVRLRGLYEMIEKNTPRKHMRVLETLYVDLNNHLMGIGQTTCAKQFAYKWAGKISWYQPA